MFVTGQPLYREEEKRNNAYPPPRLTKSPVGTVTVAAWGGENELRLPCSLFRGQARKNKNANKNRIKITNKNNGVINVKNASVKNKNLLWLISLQSFPSLV